MHGYNYYIDVKTTQVNKSDALKCIKVSISGSFPKNGNSGAAARKEERAMKTYGVDKKYTTWDTCL